MSSKRSRLTLVTKDPLPPPVPEGRRRKAVGPWREMHDRYGPLLRLFFKRFFLPIRVPTSVEKRLQELSQRGHLVFVMEGYGTLLYLFLNHLCLRLRLPLASYGNGIGAFVLFQPIGKVLGLWLSRILPRAWKRARLFPRRPISSFYVEGLTENRSLVLFLRRYRRFGKRGYEEVKEFLEDLVEFQAGCRRPVYLVPLGILWGKRPEKMQKGILDILLGGERSAGRLRQTLRLLRYARHSIVSMGEVVNLQDYRRQNAHLEKDLLLKKLRWRLHRELEMARTQVTGPTLKPRKYILESILSSRRLRELGREIARSEGVPFDRVMKRAAKYADEIAADYHITYIEFLAWVLTWVWNNIYSGFSVDEKGLERVKEAVRRGAVILMPSHKSHVDYLVLSYIFYQNDLPPPHIAAGVNLSFWPLGHIFRKAGAFFLRRTIRGQKLYAAVFSTYLRQLLREGYVQEFFLEGTRSRTGKLLHPKLGMLSMELEAFAEGVAEDLLLVPISITYEKVVEEASYSKELGGAGKEKERLLSLLRTPKFLKKKYGRVHIQFAEPLSVREYLKTRQVDLASADGGRRKRIVEDLALRVSYAINNVTTVTPSALAATVLLNHPKRGMPRAELLKQASFLLRLLEDLGARKSAALQNLGWALDEALEMFVGDRIIQRWEDPEGPIYTVEDDRRIQLDYYKNNILHFFLPFSLSANVFRLSGTYRLAEAKFLEGLGIFMELFSREFLFPREDPARYYWKVVEHHLGVRRGYLTKEEGEIRILNPGPLEYLGGLLVNFFESYWIFLGAAGRILERGGCERKKFFAELLRVADSRFRKGDVSRRESRSSFVFRNALDTMVSMGCIRTVDGKGGAVLELEPGGVEKMRRYRDILASVLSPKGLVLTRK